MFYYHAVTIANPNSDCAFARSAPAESSSDESFHTSDEESEGDDDAEYADNVSEGLLVFPLGCEISVLASFTPSSMRVRLDVTVLNNFGESCYELEWQDEGKKQRDYFVLFKVSGKAQLFATKKKGAPPAPLAAVGAGQEGAKAGSRYVRIVRA